MEPTDNESLTSLTDEQIERITEIVLDEFGPTLTRSVFNDVVLAVFENIAGLDLMT